MQIASNALGVYHVQHVLCHVVRRDSSAAEFDRVHFFVCFHISAWTSEISSTSGGHVKQPRSLDQSVSRQQHERMLAASLILLHAEYR